MLWLSQDQLKFKVDEIGSHRKYSRKSKNAATKETFKNEFETIMQWLAKTLKPGGYACFVVGDSTIGGETVDNSQIVITAGAKFGINEVSVIERKLQATRKAFNPKIGKIRSENIIILQNQRY